MPQVVLQGVGGGVKSVACGTAHTAAMTVSGDVYSWGKHDDGRLGFEATADQLRVRLPRVPPIDSPEEGAPCCTSERPFLRFNLGRADCGWPALRTTAVPPLAFGY